MRKKSRLKKGIIPTLLIVALLCLGTLFGLSVGIVTRAVAGETLPQLWGSALGAGIGATATLWAALYNQKRIERREQSKALNEVLIPMLEAQGAMMDAHNRANSVQLPNGASRAPEIGQHLDRALKNYDAIRQTSGLPEMANERIWTERMHLSFLFDEVITSLGVAKFTNTAGDWQIFQDNCSALIVQLDSGAADLKELLYNLKDD